MTVTAWEIVGIAILGVVLVSYLVALVSVFADVFGDSDLAGWGKAAWVVLLLIIPVLGVLLYLVARGDHMGQRASRQSRRWSRDPGMPGP
jgi:hypothetical protein